MNTKGLILLSKLCCDIENYCELHLILPDDLIRRSIGQPVSQPFLINPKVFTPRKKKNRMLSILSELWKNDSNAFDSAAYGIGGTERTWFGNTRQEVEGTGSSNSAARIPDSGWWVSTNCPVGGMVSRVQKIMIAMGFTREYAYMIAWSIEDGKGRLNTNNIIVKLKIR